MKNKGISSKQHQLQMLSIVCAGADGSPEALGFDRLLVSSITDNGVGDYKINLLKGFQRDLVLMGWSSLTAGVVECVVVAADEISITINLLDAAGAAIEGDVVLSILASDHRYDVAR